MTINNSITVEFISALKFHAKAHGIDAETIDKFCEILPNFLQKNFPEIQTIGAIRELRWQHSRSKVQAQPPYPGLKSGIDPIAYLLEHYGDDVRSGNLGSGRLETLDGLLHASIRTALRRAIPPQTIAEFFTKESNGRVPGSMGQRRIQACAAILGSRPEDAVRFFCNVRSDRLGSWEQRAGIKDGTAGSRGERKI